MLELHLLHEFTADTFWPNYSRPRRGAAAVVSRCRRSRQTCLASRAPTRFTKKTPPSLFASPVRVSVLGNQQKPIMGGTKNTTHAVACAARTASAAIGRRPTLASIEAPTSKIPLHGSPRPARYQRYRALQLFVAIGLLPVCFLLLGNYQRGAKKTKNGVSLAFGGFDEADFRR